MARDPFERVGEPFASQGVRTFPESAHLEDVSILGLAHRPVDAGETRFDGVFRVVQADVSMIGAGPRRVTQPGGPE